MVQKPWGYYKDIIREEFFVFKKIVVKPGHSLSYQVHKFRDEIWCIKDGIGVFTKNDLPQIVLESSVLHINAGDKHKVENTSDTDLVIYELQYGSVCSEDDIVRLEDKYGRT